MNVVGEVGVAGAMGALGGERMVHNLLENSPRVNGVGEAGTGDLIEMKPKVSGDVGWGEMGWCGTRV